MVLGRHGWSLRLFRRRGPSWRKRAEDARRGRGAGRPELPGDDDQDGHGDDPGERDDDEVGLDSAGARLPGRALGSERLLVPREAGVELVDVELAVEPEVLRVRPQEAL